MDQKEVESLKLNGKVRLMKFEEEQEKESERERERFGESNNLWQIDPTLDTINLALEATCLHQPH